MKTETNPDMHCSTRYNVEHILHTLVFVIAVILIGILSLEIMYVTSKDQNTELMPANPPFVVAVAIKQSDNLQELNRVLNRPLFSQNRHPAADIAPSVARSAEPLPRLTGVVVSPAGGFAIFAHADDDKLIVVGRGDHVGTAVVETVSVGRVTLRGPDGIVVLHPNFHEMTLRADQLDLVELAEPGYRPLRQGHYAAFWKAVAIATRTGSTR